MNVRAMIVPERLAAACRDVAQRTAWLERLPAAIRSLEDRWGLSVENPFDGRDGSCAWVAPARRRNGSRAVLKLGMPHLEGADELKGLRFWNGDPTVHLLEADAGLNAMLLEHCDPGRPLRERPEPEQDVVVARLLRRLWRTPVAPNPFRSLSAMTAHWADETGAAASRWRDAGLVRDGLRLLEELSCPSIDDVLLATDLHAGNVLRAQLVIDPKPFVGNRAYDATQHLLNCRQRMLTAPDATIRRFADLVEVDEEPIRLWMFARSAAEPCGSWNDDSLILARLIVP
jgi:streptomycin 6-kinase